MESGAIDHKAYQRDLWDKAKMYRISKPVSDLLLVVFRLLVQRQKIAEECLNKNYPSDSEAYKIYSEMIDEYNRRIAQGLGLGPADIGL